MASAEVMAMPVDTPTGGDAGKERQQQAAAEDAGAAQDVYVKLKSLQKHMEFLDIQVRLWRQVRRFLYQCLAVTFGILRSCGNRSLDFGVSLLSPQKQDK